MIYTPKQRALMELWRTNKLKRLNVLEGSVSSGKTWISLVMWAFWVQSMPPTGLFLMCAKSITTLKRNCLLLLQDLVGESNFQFSTTSKEGYLFGRRVILEGANDIRSESKIRGLTLQGAYCDELTQFPQDFFAMLLSRLRLPGAKLIATTNPDTPRHWLKTDYIDRADELDFLDVKFLIDDNTTLPQDYVDSIKREYVGVYYDRFILGKWVIAEGLIYRDFADHPEKYTVVNPVAWLTERNTRFSTISFGVDFGGTGSATKFQCTGITPECVVVALEEEYIDHKKQSVDPDALNKMYSDFIRRCTRKWGGGITRADSAEQILIRGLFNTALSEGLQTQVKNALKMPITDRIKLTLLLMAQGRFFVSSACPHLADALASAVYDDSKPVDTRLDDGTSDIDSLDAMEYSIEPYYKQLEAAGHRIGS